MIKLKGAFAKTAKPENYVFNYEREVREFYRQFPQHRESVYFVETGYDALLGREKGYLEFEELYRMNSFQKCLSEAKEEGSRVYSFEFSGKRPDFHCVFLNLKDNKSSRLVTYNHKSTSVEQAFVLDHELGHALCNKGMKGDHLSECVADAYASIRHVQRFGRDPTFLKTLTDSRALHMVFKRSMTHFTSPVVKRIIEDNAVFDFSKLSPAQTMQAATRYATRYAVTEKRRYGLIYAFQYLAIEEWGRVPSQQIAGSRSVAQLIDEVPKVRDSYARSWGAYVLRMLSDNRARYQGKPLKLPARHKEEIKSVLKKTEKKNIL